MTQSNAKNMFKVAQIGIVYRNKIPAHERPKVTLSEEAYHILLSTWDMNRIELLEQFKIILLNRGHRVMGISEISTGGIAGCVADPKIIFGTALKAGASGIIMAHNHPSSNLTPSQADIELTRKMKEGAKFLEIQVMDHLIVTPTRYYSFADEGMMP